MVLPLFFLVFPAHADIVATTHLDQIISTKADKITAPKQVYLSNGAGEQTSIAYDMKPTGNTFPMRGTGAVLKVGEPMVDIDAATKGYVDTSVANKVSKTGAESVAGVKTFSDIPLIPTASLPVKQ